MRGNLKGFSLFVSPHPSPLQQERVFVRILTELGHCHDFSSNKLPQNRIQKIPTLIRTGIITVFKRD